MATDQELQLEYEYAQARAKADAERNAAAEAEIQANGPRNSSGSPDDRQVANDQVKQEEYDNNYVSGIENIPHNTMLEAKGLAKGVANAGIGVLQTANAVGHSIGSGLGRAYDAVAPSIGLSPRDPASVKAADDQASKEQKFFQDNTFQQTTGPDKFFMPAGQVAATVAAGGGIGGAVKEAAAPIVGKIGGYLAGAAAGGAAAASTFPQQEGLLVRSDGFVGFGINPEDSPATQQTKKFLNQSIDNMMLGVVGDGAYALGKKGKEVVTNVIKSFTNHGSLSKIQQQAAEDVVAVFGQLGEHPTAEQQQQAAQQVIDLIDKNGTAVYDFGEGVGKKEVKRDTISSITNGMDQSDPIDRAIATRMEALRSSAKRGNAPKTAVQLQEPERVLNEGLQEAQAVRGGDTAIDQTKQVLQDRATQEAGVLDQGVQNAKDDLAQQSADYTDVIAKDPTFGPEVQKAKEGGIPLDINKKQREIKGTIVDKSKAALETDRNIRNAAYKAVADTGAPANMDEFMQIVEDNKSTLSPELQKIIEGADGSYGYLYNKVRNRLSKEIGDARTAGKPVDGLYALKRDIDEGQIDWLTGKGGPFGLPVEPGSADDIGQIVKNAADNAKKVNTEYSAKWKDTIGDELRNNFDKNRMAPGSLQEKGRDLVDAAISNPNRKESIENLRNILGPEGESLISDAALAKATQDITAGKGANFDQITDKLQQYANSFGPKQKARLEGFLSDLKAKKMSLEELGAKIPQLEKDAAAEKEAIFGERFPGLFENVGGKKLPKDRGYEVFEDAMNAKQPTQLKALIKQAQKNPEDMSGIQTAWLKSAEKKINSNPKSIGELDENFIDNGKLIFGEGSDEVKAITGLRDEVSKLQSSLNRPGMEGLSATENQSNLKSAISLVQTFIFGVLNPTAARVNKITSNLAKSYSSVDTSHQAIDNILSDNQEMRQAMVNLINKSKNRLSPATWKQLFTAGARLGLYELKPEKGLNFQTNKALQK
jgi:hypothetical protein